MCIRDRSNAALYYVEKAIAIIDNVRNNLDDSEPVSYTHLRAHETSLHLKLPNKLE